MPDGGRFPGGRQHSARCDVSAAIGGNGLRVDMSACIFGANRLPWVSAMPGGKGCADKFKGNRLDGYAGDARARSWWRTPGGGHDRHCCRVPRHDGSCARTDRIRMLCAAEVVPGEFA